MKATLSEIKKNPQGTNSDRKEARVQINDLEHKEEMNNQPEQNEEIRIQNHKERSSGQDEGIGRNPVLPHTTKSARKIK